MNFNIYFLIFTAELNIEQLERQRSFDSEVGKEINRIEKRSLKQNQVMATVMLNIGYIC